MKLKLTLLLAMMAASSQAAVINLVGIGATATDSGGSGAGTLAIDQMSGTRWNSETGPQDPAWMMIDLGQEYTLDGLRIDWETAGAADYTLRTSTALLDSNTQLASFPTADTIAGHNAFPGAGDNDGLDGLGGGASDDDFDWTTGSVTLNGGGTATTSTASTGASGQYLLIHSTARTTGFGNSIHEVELSGTAVPEPSSAALFGLGGLALLLRRRR